MKKIRFLKYLIFVVAVFFIYMLLRNPGERVYKINVIKTANNSVLVDDFNNGLDKNYWNVIERGDNYNEELQYYSPNNLSSENGILEIEARKEDFKDHKYTSGLITTQNKFEFLYGKIIFKAKPAVGKGMVSAIWLLPADDSSFPEVDIIEILGTENNRIWTGVHYLDSNSEIQSNFVDYASSKDFSTYELDWEENEIRFYVDNQLIYKTNVGIPNKKMYLIINLSVGGIWAKDPDDGVFPTKFSLDYVIIIPKELNVS